MRARLAQPLPDVVADVVRTIGIDVEVLARGGDVMPMRANLDRLIEVAAEFAAGGDEVSVGAFLDYLDAAAVEERGLDRGEEPESSAPEIHEGIGVRRDRVQLLTVHAAKGLEWDVVCVPGLVDKLFPGVRPADVKGWLTQRGALAVAAAWRSRWLADGGARRSRRPSWRRCSDRAFQGGGHGASATRRTPARLCRRHSRAQHAAVHRLPVGSHQVAERRERVSRRCACGLCGRRGR